MALAAALAEGVLYGSGTGVVWGGGEGRELWQQADAAYRRALELAPEDLDIHLRYLEMLWRDCTVCDATSAPPNFVTTLNHASALAPANPTVLFYESQLEAGGTASAAYFATATQEAIRPSLTTTPRAALTTTASVPTALPGVAARRGLPTPTTWIQPIATSVVPGTVQAGSAGQRRDVPVAVAGVLLVAIGLAAWAYRRHG